MFIHEWGTSITRFIHFICTIHKETPSYNIKIVEVQVKQPKIP